MMIMLSSFIVAMINLECVIVILQCFILSVIYVGSLYVWRNRHERDHPSTIIRRFISVTVVALISPLYLYFCIDAKYLNRFTLWQLVGLRCEGLVQAVTFPLLLTVILFLGPVSFQIANGSWVMYTDLAYWRRSLTDLVWVRNRIMAPLSEELPYRACMIPLLLQCFPDLSTCFINPIFFGTAHFNHLLENLRAGGELTRSLLITGAFHVFTLHTFSLSFAVLTFRIETEEALSPFLLSIPWVKAVFHFLYTSIFGAYSTFLFLRTGHLVAPIIAHMFCNHMGFPDLSEPFLYSGVKRYILFSSFFLGLGLFYYLLVPLTEPNLYYNSLYWYQSYSEIKNT